MYKKKFIVVIIPCYKVDVKTTIKIIKKIPFFVDKIYVVDDACPFKTGGKIKSKKIKKVTILFNSQNLGVGGSVLRVYKKLKYKNCFIIKIDGDGQMNPKLIRPILNNMISKNLDYIKGNRFKDYKNLFKQMPYLRIFGNYILSYLSMISSGYKKIFDCTNGYTCIKTSIIRKLPIKKIHKRFFFETDILFYLSKNNAKIQDFYMSAQYGDEKSNLNLIKIIPQFSYLLIKNYIIRNLK